MMPRHFAEATVTYAEDQPEYLPLPAFRDAEGQVITCWQLTWRERLCVLWQGAVWLRVLTFGQRLQPVMIEATSPFPRST